jgi:hypothetical protein
MPAKSPEAAGKAVQPDRDEIEIVVDVQLHWNKRDILVTKQRLRVTDGHLAVVGQKREHSIILAAEAKAGH